MESSQQSSISAAERQKIFEEKSLERQKQLSEKKKLREEQEGGTGGNTQANIEIWNQIQTMKKSIDFDNDDNEEIVSKWKQLQQFVNLNSQKLSKYDLQKAQSDLKQIEAKIQEKMNEIKSQKKFSFKSSSKKKTEPSNAQQPQTNEQIMPIQPEKDDPSSIAKKIVQDINNSPSPVNFSSTIDPSDDFLVTNCSNSTLFTTICGGAVFLKHLENINIFLAPVSASSFISHAKNCNFLIASKQLRIHDCENCKFFVFSRSSPIIEHSDVLEFGSFSEGLELFSESLPQEFAEYSKNEMKSDFEKMEFDLEKNFYNEVKDFNWLKSTPSPHWKLHHKK